MHALCLFALAPTGFRHREFRDHVAQLHSRTPDTYSASAMTYDLRRLRLHGLIERVPNSHRYRITNTGAKAAMFYARLYTRALRPAASLQPLASDRAQRAFDHPDPGSKDHSVRLKTFFSIRTDGQTIDTDGPYAALNEIAGSINAQRDVVLKKVTAMRPVEIGVPGLEQEALTQLRLVKFEFRAGDELFMSDFNDACAADRGAERHCIHRPSVGNKMQRSIHVGAGMCAHRDCAQVRAVTGLHIRRLPDVQCRCS